MLSRKFELTLIKIGFFTNFLICSKIRPKTLYYSRWSLAKFHQKWQGENSSFLLKFLIHNYTCTYFFRFKYPSILIFFQVIDITIIGTIIYIISLLMTFL